MRRLSRGYSRLELLMVRRTLVLGSFPTILFRIRGWMRLRRHEVGHAFGLDHSDGEPSESIMHRVPSDDLCNPTAYDIVAMKAVYQSR